jgi:ArsR family transcriptional regulator, arsenate/arsenite/antimonite-responsive transcriptional repressor
VVDSASVELRAARFRALGDPTRLRILEALADGPTCVCTLREHAEVSGPLMSHHLNVLRVAGLVTAARRGRWVDYALADGALEQLAASLRGTMSGLGA